MTKKKLGNLKFRSMNQQNLIKAKKNTQFFVVLC